MSFDWNKPFVCVNGSKARLIGKVEHPFAPYIVAVTESDGAEKVNHYRDDGRPYPYNSSTYKLVNVLKDIKPFHMYITRKGLKAVTGHKTRSASHGPLEVIDCLVENKSLGYSVHTGGKINGKNIAGRLFHNEEHDYDLVQEIGPIPF